MSETAIPFLFMRGGTSRGPYFRRADLPEDRDALSKVLIAVIGAGNPLNIDGIGGGVSVTTKVAMLSVSEDEWADVDYFFAQVSVDKQTVDYKPTCGNILSGVGPAAIELGLVDAAPKQTSVKIRSVNTGARVVAELQTPGGHMTYDGDTHIDGVPGTAAPIVLNFMDVVGGATGKLLPTGHLRDRIDGIEVTCLDVAMPLVIARASDFGKSGQETAAELDEDANFLERMESIRRQAGQLMGLGDVSDSVVPKFGLLAPAAGDGTIATRYFTPKKTHPTMAVTGGQCLATAAILPGTVSDGLLDRPSQSPAHIVLEHASGTLDVTLQFAHGESGFELKSAGLLRTARKLADGNVFVPNRVWAGHIRG